MDPAKCLAKTRILILHPNMEVGGTETQIVNMVNGLVARGHCEVFVALYEVRGALLNRLIQSEFVHVLNLSKNSRGLIFCLFRLLKLITRFEINVICTFLVGPNVLSALIGLLNRNTRIIWGNRISWFEKSDFGIKGRLSGALEVLLSRTVDVVVANSNSGMVYQMERGLKGKANKVIYNGIQTTKFNANSNIRDEVRLELGISKDEMVIGIVARVVAWKGYDIFLKAARILVQKRKNIKFLCVGKGDSLLMEKYRRLSAEYGLQDYVNWLGERRDVHRLLNGIDIVTLPSLRGEGFSNAVGEAMATGIPVVATDVGDTRQILGKVGCLVPPGDAAALVDAWFELIENEEYRVKLGVSARSRVCGCFSVTQMVDSMGAVLLDNSHKNTKL